MFRLSFVQACQRYFHNTFLFGGIGSVVCVFFLCHNAFNCKVLKSFIAAALFYCVLFVLMFLYYLIKNAVHLWTERTSLGKSFVLTEQILCDCKKITAQTSEKELNDVLQRICNLLRTYLEGRYNCACCVSINVPVSDDGAMNQLVLQNLMIDQNHCGRRNEKYLYKEHYAIENSSYSYVLGKLSALKSKCYYINNNIPKDKNYLSSLTDCFESGLPFKSEILFPIIPLRGEGNAPKDPELKGFLRVDSIDINKFTCSKVDESFFNIILDSIFNII